MECNMQLYECINFVWQSEIFFIFFIIFYYLLSGRQLRFCAAISLFRGNKKSKTGFSHFSKTRLSYRKREKIRSVQRRARSSVRDIRKMPG